MRRVIDSTAGMYGDLQGIAGKGLNEIEGLEIAEQVSIRAAAVLVR